MSNGLSFGTGPGPGAARPGQTGLGRPIVRPEQPVQKWKAGERITERRLNRTVDAVNKMRFAVGTPQQIVDPPTTSATLEIVIDKAIAVETDAVEEYETANFEFHGPHLSCFKIGLDSEIEVGQPIVVFPVRGLSIARFKRLDGGQIFTAGTSPAFTAIQTVRGNILAFAEAFGLWPDPIALGLPVCGTS